MDHILERIEVFYEIYLDEYLDEQERNNHSNLSDNPVYRDLKVIIASMNPLREYLGLSRLKLNQEVKSGLERRVELKCISRK
ncbi:hypothetical protein J3A84_05255 [Proteiniclasticum sp. SCR006]|uniref:Uncharacterized protein n=1 Tax=Proteiniclasticum aestuarii TaxID=2817862 RepID=A0A939KIS5_9CLOT|nr:hypothetical protein [Proteiniclasticum aestuarii]MBO1264448.1 hypothetical protein [Proteiniclasticum aestuarii]